MVAPVPGPSSSEPPRAGPDILVVDDNEQNIELLTAFLEDITEAENGSVRTAHDGIEALRQIQAKAPDLLLLDIMMPRMSGFQLCTRLKADAATRSIPIMMVTALSEVSDMERATECGADDFVSKPVNKLELLARVRTLLGRKTRS